MTGVNEDFLEGRSVASEGGSAGWDAKLSSCNGHATEGEGSEREGAKVDLVVRGEKWLYTPEVSVLPSAGHHVVVGGRVVALGTATPPPPLRGFREELGGGGIAPVALGTTLGGPRAGETPPRTACRGRPRSTGQGGGSVGSRLNQWSGTRGRALPPPSKRDWLSPQPRLGLDATLRWEPLQRAAR